MKNFLILLLVNVFALNGFSQAKEPQPPFKLNAPMPKFKIMNVLDSVAFTNESLKKNQKTIFIYFGPECGHCSFFAKKLIDSVSLLENTQVVMMSSFEFSKIRKFYDENRIATCPIITMGFDPSYFFVTYYGVTQFPAAYIYNSKGKFVKSFQGEIGIKEMADVK
jgi:thiol-disulfide isomerase/thioredoxin